MRREAAKVSGTLRHRGKPRSELERPRGNRKWRGAQPDRPRLTGSPSGPAPRSERPSATKALSNRTDLPYTRGPVTGHAPLEDARSS
ncbi:hypothetical protein ATO2_03715 [Roseovarius sp. 22II1-1F6A]|nr:hypothetical protein ATO2_03715 [Roseovarius sp. 22II1-1F6A]